MRCPAVPAHGYHRRHVVWRWWLHCRAPWIQTVPVARKAPSHIQVEQLRTAPRPCSWLTLYECKVESSLLLSIQRRNKTADQMTGEQVSAAGATLNRGTLLFGTSFEMGTKWLPGSTSLATPAAGPHDVVVCPIKAESMCATYQYAVVAVGQLRPTCFVIPSPFQPLPGWYLTGRFSTSQTSPTSSP